MGYRETLYWFVFVLVIHLVISLAFNTIFLFRFAWNDTKSRTRQIAQNISVSGFSVLVILILLELFFKVFFVQSDGFFSTLASRKWFERYWQENSLGYRDVEWTPELVEGRTKVMVLGDSFAAGYGIQNPADRFSNILDHKLGQDYVVTNVSVPGANTKDEIQNALGYPYQPDIVILSFYVNDIETTAKDMGFRRPPRIGPIPSGVKPFIEESYLLNFAYWRIRRLGPQEWYDDYAEWLAWTYNHPDIWQIYSDELLQIHHLAQERNRRLIIVVFPNLVAIEESQPITSKVINLFKERGVPVLDVADSVEGIPVDQLIVNPFDAHPNEFVHRLVAEALYPMVLDSQQSQAK